MSVGPLTPNPVFQGPTAIALGKHRELPKTPERQFKYIQENNTWTKEV